MGAAAEQFERTGPTTTFLVPSTTTTAPLQLESFVSAAPHFVGPSPSTTGAIAHAHSTHQQHQHHHQHQHQHQQTTNSTSSSYTFVQIKREPCQVSEVSSNQPSITTNGSHSVGSGATSAALASISGTSASTKTMSSSTLTTLVKIEAPSPKVHDMDKAHVATLSGTPAIASTNNSVPIGIAVARKRPQESTPVTLCGANALPVQQSMNKDMNCFGIRMADLGGVGAGCGNIFFTGNGDLMTSSATAEELALNAAGVQSVNRAPSTFWQYPNALPIESVISMSPATVGLQYSREASRGQVVLLPAPAAALGISNFPLYTPTDPFQQAAAFVWPSYIPQGTSTAPTLPSPNFIFPSMSPHSALQPQSYATSLQLFGSNYLTAAAAAAAAAAATSTLCQHNQQTNSSTSSINLSLGAPGTVGGGSSSSTTSSSSSSCSRYLSVTPAATVAESSKQHKQLTTTALPYHPPSLLVPPQALKIEEWNATEFMSSAAKTTTTTTLSAATHQNHQLVAPLAATALNFAARDKTTTTTTTTTNLLELQANAQSLNLMRLPTPPTSATIGSVAASATQLQQQILFHPTPQSPAPAVINLTTAALPRPTPPTAITSNGIGATNFLNSSTTTTLSAAIGPPTPHSDEAVMNFKTAPLDASPPQIVIGVPRVISNSAQQTPGPPPQMQDVNIQTDTPVCSEDENSSCPLAIQQQQHQLQSIAPAHSAGNSITSSVELYAHDLNAQQPLELTKSSSQSNAIIENSSENQITELNVSKFNSLCHNEGKTSEIDMQCRSKEIVTADIQKNYKFTNLSLASSAPMSCVDTTTASAPEDLTGLELLSNISTSSLAKNAIVRIKQEPVEHGNELIGKDEPKRGQNGGVAHKLQTTLMDMGNSCALEASMVRASTPNVCRQVDAMPLGGLSLLCALAEQRIQEEVESSGNLFASSNNVEELQKREQTPPSQIDGFRTFAQQSPTTSFHLDQSFPSMEGVEMPSTSGVSEQPVKHKKRKHSKSSKSSSQEKKRSQRSGKKNKKKYAKEKRKHKFSPKNSDLDDEKVQEELKSAFNHVDPSYNQFGNWPTPAEIFKIMETDMRMRLADITRQYHKKKRKLEEINKKRKKRKCSKLVALQQQQATALALSSSTSSAMTLGAVTASNNNNGVNGLSCTSTTSTSLNCDYKFPKFTNSTVSTACTNSTTTSLLQPSSFLSFKEKSQNHAQFPPPDAGGLSDDDEKPTPSSSSSLIFKPVRLEPSALRASANSALRLSQKHTVVEKTSTTNSVCKEPKLIATSRLGNDCEDERKVLAGTADTRTPRKAHNPMDERLMLTSEHLYRKETRVLTDMGGLFYAGVMNPLQPPDVYAITLDGERGNKPHIMSREEIFKDTILEVAPKSVESVPVGTRLCAYWSQQYRCLYPGRATGSEASDDGVTSPDFVSVEFDDGDSGRIRLQNIRLLLSDYPIAEYNDNPLYSLGKQKKSSHKSGHTSDSNHYEHSASILDGNQHLVKLKSSFSPARGIDGLETNTKTCEFYAKRSEKKRLKSLRKKSQVANLLNGIHTTTTIVTATTTTTAAISVTSAITLATVATTQAPTITAATLVDGNECGRKHHKHKKHKKHKKHHHRKNQIDAKEGNSCSYMLSTLNKRDEELQQQVVEYTAKQSKESHKNVPGMTSTSIKMEILPTASLTSGIKVKSENLDLEEETQSNLLSEVSDEVKGEDEVEHNNSKGSKIAAFLPERQLWGWLGKAYRKAGVKGRARKQFYKSIKRGKETITVRDCAVFLSTGRPDRPYIGRIESMWETTSSNKVVRVRWFYHPEETIGCPNLKYPGALFESPHEDENDVQTISHRCEVHPFARYFSKFGADSKQYQSIYDNNDTYYLAGYYNPRLQVLKLEDDIPTLEEQNTTTET